ncbi:hypothetical protein PIB30_073988 [Stylosanthes scabra]|uniref:Uncharacterized protein n=1 Tax=Stylosanthes scabra TaxID=79078 RepID=A0ABU6SQV9_9FABA|nr:hypothetical protein [Stylosanthes scabra]
MKAKQEEFFSNQVNQYNMIRQDQKLLGKEILDVKKYQMSAVTMRSGGSSSSPQPPPPYEPDQALMKIREGLLKSDLQPSNPAPPPSSCKDPKDPPSSSKDSKDP